MRKLVFLLGSLLCAVQVFAQSTTVSGQVTDAGGQSWNNGTVAAQFLPNPLYPTFPQYSWTGGVLNQVVNGTLNATGGYSISVPSSTAITPLGSFWQFKFCPQASSPCFITANISITGGTQTVNATPPAISVTAGPGVTAYADTEITGAVIGSTYYSTTSSGIRVCNGPTNPCSWSAAGVVNGAGSNPLGASFNVISSGADPSAKKTVTAITGNGSGTITDATSAGWLSTDVGKKIFCIGLNGDSALTTTIATINAFTSSSSIGINTTGNGNAQNPSTCVWFTAKSTTAFQSASTSAAAALKAIRPFLGPTLAYPSNVYCPPGGYVVDGPFFIQNNASSNSLGVGFIGSGKGSCTIYISPDVAISNNSWILNSTQATGFVFSGFTVDCNLEHIALAAPGMNFNTDGHFRISDVELDGCGTANDSQGLVRVNASVDGMIDGLTLNNALTGAFPSAEPPILIGGGSASITVRNLYTTNPSPQPIQINASGSSSSANASGPRSLTQNTILIENSIMDEGSNPGCVSIIQSSVNFVGVTCMEGTLTGVSVDANSSLYMTDSLIAPFNGGCSAGTRQALTIATTGYVEATGSDFESCGTDGTGLSAAVKGTSAGTFVSAGGNTWRTCTGSVPCPLITAANFATRAFNGGIIPKSSETHTPNTCTDTLGTVVATVLCNTLLDQNYQILNITASSNAVTTCATAPIVTISDGTQTATLTLTSGASTWSTGALAAANASVFASGNTMTITYDLSGAAACVTPPTNLAVSYVLQSVLNP